MLKFGSFNWASVKPEFLAAELFAQRPFVKGKLNFKRLIQAALQPIQRRTVEALGLQRRMIDERRALQRAPARAIGDHLLNLRLSVAQGLQCRRQALIDDLEVAATRQLLELHQSKVRFDAGGVAIHYQADGPCRRNDRRLRIAESIRRAEFQRAVPGSTRGEQQIRRALFRLNPLRFDRELFIVFSCRVIGRTSVVVNDAQHRVSIARMAFEWSELRRHLRGGGIGLSRHEGRDRAADRQRFR